MQNFILKSINENNKLAGTIAVLIVAVVVIVCAFLLGRRFYLYRKTVADKLAEKEVERKSEETISEREQSSNKKNETEDVANTEKVASEDDKKTDKNISRRQGKDA